MKDKVNSKLVKQESDHIQELTSDLAKGKISKKEYLDDNVTPNILNEPIPEYLDSAKKEKLIPDETFVLVGYYKDDNHLKWIDRKRLYNVRYGERYGLKTNEIGAQYLLLYSKDQVESTLFFKLKKNGAKFYSKSELKEDLEYRTSPSQEMYLVYQLEDDCEKEFSGLNIDLNKLNGLGANKKPIAITLTELLKAKITNT